MSKEREQTMLQLWITRLGEKEIIYERFQQFFELEINSITTHESFVQLS
jgi:hypothetical protein